MSNNLKFSKDDIKERPATEAELAEHKAKIEMVWGEGEVITEGVVRFVEVDGREYTSGVMSCEVESSYLVEKCDELLLAVANNLEVALEGREIDRYTVFDEQANRACGAAT